MQTKHLDDPATNDNPLIHINGANLPNIFIPKALLIMYERMATLIESEAMGKFRITDWGNIVDKVLFFKPIQIRKFTLPTIRLVLPYTKVRLSQKSQELEIIVNMATVVYVDYVTLMIQPC